VLGDDIKGTSHRKCRNRRAAGQRFELNNPESIRETWENEHISGRYVAWQIPAGLFS
jgi:hypothetical protein